MAMDGTGVVITDIDNGSSDIGYDIQIQADGKLVAGGISSITVGKTTYTDSALVRYNGDGTLDRSFSGDGKAITRTTDSDRISSLAIQNDQKIVTAGDVLPTKGNASRDIALARYNPDGSLDTSFDGDGRVVTATKGPDIAEAIRLQTYQKIVVAGRLGNRFGVVRYNANGALDASFGGTGMVTPDFGIGEIAFSAAEDVAIQGDGKIIAGGWGYVRSGRGVDAEIHNSGFFLIARYNADGSLDSSFDSDGKLTHFISSYASIAKIAVQPDGKIVAVGIGSAPVAGGASGIVARYNSDGSLDTSFGNSGVVQHPYSLKALALQSDGKIVVAGNNGGGFWVSRLDANGNLDPTFSGMGTVEVFPTGRVEAIHALPDDKLVLIGTQEINTAVDFVVVRLNSDGTPDPTFGPGAAAMSTSTSALTTGEQSSKTTASVKTSDTGSRLALDAVSVEQLLAERESTWTRKSRIKMRV